MNNVYSMLLAGLLMIVFQGCKKDDDSDPSEVPTGRITGQLKLADELGVELTDHSNMIITATNGVTGISTVNGNYQVANLATGTYNLTYQKAGFGTYKRFNIQVIAGTNATTLNGTDYLGQKSTTEITGLSASINPGDTTYNFQCSISPVPTAASQRSFRMFFGKNASVNSVDYQYTPQNTWVASTVTGQISGFPVSQLISNGFNSGETVYLVAYGESIRTNAYTDPVTGKKIFPNLNISAPSNVVSFMLP